MTTPPQAPLPSAPPPLRRFLVRVAPMALLWAGLNGTDWGSWAVGGPLAIAAAWISVKLPPAVSWRCSPRGAIAFAGYFLRESIRGGWDVARRALSFRLTLDPAIVCYESRLPAGAARILFCSAISLLPGTAVVAMEEKRIGVHFLAWSPSAELGLRELERRVAALFGHPLTGETEGET